jgi:polyhydroxyalkanoate synthesis regulator phasin
MQEQQAFIESLAMRYNKFSTEVNEFMAGVGSTIANVEASCRDTNFQLKELKDYVDHFADNLVLSSGQITVETDAGFTIKPTSLTETLKLARHTLTELETGAEKTGEKIEQITSDLDTKAPDTVLFNVSTLERKVSTIEVHLRKEEEQGIGVSGSAVVPGLCLAGIMRLY